MTGIGKSAQATSLFRAEALRDSRNSVFGSVLLAAPISFSVAAITVTLIASALIAIAVLGRYTQRETVSGFVAVSAGEVRVYPQAAGIVTEIPVGEGASVAAGATLFSLMTSRNDGMSAATNGEILDALSVEKSALDLQLKEQRLYFEKESQRLTQVIDNTTYRIGSLNRQLQLGEQRLVVARRDAERAQGMRQKGFLSERDHDAVAMTTVERQMAVESAAGRIAELESDRQDAQARLDQLQHLLNTRLSEIAESSGRLAQRMAVVRAGLAQMVVAPIDGTVSAIHITRGQTVSSDSLALSLIPESTTMHAELLVPGRSIGLLDAQQAVELRFDAYPFEKYGTYSAKLERAAGSLLFPGDARLPVAITEPVYRVRATLARQAVNVDGQPRALTPGMTFRADILLGERTLLEWMMAPALGTKRRFQPTR
ncbi:MAG: HlyD family efflux transporter periplasmic adaptor subunit [Gammaproteobacteria bacterium]|nr:HlyD family efflux transporter periplasmic adaptor subunit [Gammaproteobacteria bacterium]MDH4314300.1 HlyD family efflux transporter periplasmic adaptor subunit [Gammaproteobacteria bacterium]